MGARNSCRSSSEFSALIFRTTRPDAVDLKGHPGLPTPLRRSVDIVAEQKEMSLCSYFHIFVEVT